MNNRCPVCDRPKAVSLTLAAELDESVCCRDAPIPTDIEGRCQCGCHAASARLACEDHAVDWRARCLEADAILTELMIVGYRDRIAALEPKEEG